jgi:hypothetical protein
VDHHAVFLVSDEARRRHETPCPKCAHDIAYHNAIPNEPFDQTVYVYGACSAPTPTRIDMHDFERTSRCMCDLTPDDAYRNALLIAARQAKEEADAALSKD